MHFADHPYHRFGIGAFHRVPYREARVESRIYSPGEEDLLGCYSSGVVGGNVDGKRRTDFGFRCEGRNTPAAVRRDRMPKIANAVVAAAAVAVVLQGS